MVRVALVDNPPGGFYWSPGRSLLLLDGRMDEANMIITLARALRLIAQNQMEN